MGVIPLGWGKTSRHVRGYGSDWVKLRLTILQRDRYLCQPCLRLDHTTIANAVDHITPKAEGGTDDHTNLEAICDACHEAKTLIEAARAQGKTIKPRPTFTPDGKVKW